MLQEITYPQFLELREYDRMSPIGGRRLDWQTAAICSLMANIAAAMQKRRKRFRVEDFLLEFGDGKSLPNGAKKSWQEMKMIAQMIAAAFK